jgi:hypothetical protein
MRSSDAGSNFCIYKIGDKLDIRYDSGVAVGNSISWNTGFQMTTSGYIYMPNIQNVTNTNYLRYNTSTGAVTDYSSSDIRLKKNVVAWEPDSLDFLYKLGVINYDMKDGSEENVIGWNATLMRELIPEMTWLDEDGYVHLKDAHMTFHFHRAINQLYDEVKQLKKEVQTLRSA